MKDIVIIGAGGFAREIAWLLEENNKANPEWNILGYISKETGMVGKYEVIGDDDWLLAYEEEVCAVCCIANANLREKVVNKFAEKKNITFPNIISKDALMSDSVQLGIGNIICAGSILTVDISIGNFMICNLDCTIGHDTCIDDYVTIYPSVNVSGNVHIKKNCEIGTCSSIIQGVNIDEHVIVGASAAVVRDLPKNCTAVGVPAKVIRERK